MYLHFPLSCLFCHFQKISVSSNSSSSFWRCKSSIFSRFTFCVASAAGANGEVIEALFLFLLLLLLLLLLLPLLLWGAAGLRASSHCRRVVGQSQVGSRKDVGPYVTPSANQNEPLPAKRTSGAKKTQTPFITESKKLFDKLSSAISLSIWKFHEHREKNYLKWKNSIFWLNAGVFFLVLEAFPIPDFFAPDVHFAGWGSITLKQLQFFSKKPLI